MAIRLINTICSCCGKECPNLKQWHNRDTGYSICKNCIHWLKERAESDESIKHNYGIAGIHYEDAENHVSPLCHHHWVDGLDGGTLVCAHKCGAWK